MLYLIPAWYQKNQWCENEQSWYVRREHTEFDDTVKQIQLFHRSKAINYKVFLLSYSPNLRHFLHRQGVYRASYWSCFDAIQEISRKRVRMFSIHDITWPVGTEFIYTPFVVVAMLQGEKYAQVQYGEDGNPIRIEMYQNNIINRCNIYDDRGFVSSTIVYMEGKESYQDYLTAEGKRKLRVYFEDNHVEINPNCDNYLIQYEDQEYYFRFMKHKYENLEEVIQEVANAYVEHTVVEDIFCVAMHKQHINVLENILLDKKIILSFFETRIDYDKKLTEIRLVQKANYLVADSIENSQKIERELPAKSDHITDITPFDTRIESGISQQLSVQKIMVPVDKMSEEMFETVMNYLGQYLLKNKNARVSLFTRNSVYDRKKVLLEKVRNILKKSNLPEEWAEETSENHAENNLDENRRGIKFEVGQCVEESVISRYMKEQRVILELSNEPELYIQIMAISIGIPQILLKETSYTKHRKNSYVISKMEDIPTALEFYLHGLSNWNKAQVYSYELGKQYTTDVLLAKWKEVIRKFE